MRWIEPYYRIRHGRLESVRGHWRRSPHRLSATVVSFSNPNVA